MSDGGFAAARRAAREQGDFEPLRARIPYAGFLGVQIELRADEPLFRLPFRKSLIGNQVLPALHGGVVAGFMENAAMLHLLLVLDESRVPKSIDFSLDYLRSAAAIETFAACDVARLGRRVAHVQIRCWQLEKDGRERDVALARAHFLLASEADVA
ncbi:MAG TPA: PaaI family thioesterase [Candidatus Binatia bacterium]|nr:PaaI family thioesterase [Candidatus Binatia bacterium]